MTLSLMTKKKKIASGIETIVQMRPNQTLKKKVLLILTN